MPSNPGLSNHARGAAGYGRAARGLVVRGVVTRVYYLDALPAGLFVAGGPPSPSGLAPAALYCDVLVYSGIPGARTGLIPRVLITYDAGGVHDGDVAVPRATRKMVADPTGRAPDEDGGASPAVFDGDHVLVGFMDDSIDQPFVLRYLRHPHADHAKNPLAVPGEKLGLIRADGRPRLSKHLGVYFGVDKDGNFVLDLRGAHLGERGDGTAVAGGGYAPGGAEVANARLSGANAESGSCTVRLPASARLVFEFPSGRKI